MLRADLVVAIGDHEQAVRSADAAAEKFQQVERSFVGPVHVFDDGNRRLAPALHLVEDGGEDRGARGFFFKEREQTSLSLLRDVVDRPEGTRRQQRVARPPEDARLRLVRLGEALDERGLPDSRLAADEHETTIAGGDDVEQAFQFMEEVFALEQFHCFPETGTSFELPAAGRRQILLNMRWHRVGPGPTPAWSLKFRILNSLTGDRCLASEA